MIGGKVMKNKFIYVGDILLSIAVFLLILDVIFISGNIKDMKEEVEQLKTQIATLTEVNEKIKSEQEELASETDAQIQSLSEEYKKENEKLNKEIKQLQKEPEEVSKEVNEVVEEKVSATYDEPVYIEYSEPYVEEVPEPVVEEEPEVEPEPTEGSSSSYIGTYEITAYTWTGNPCADGVFPEAGVTAASNDPSLWHQWIYVDGIGDVYVHDTGGMGMGVIDIYMPSESDCINWGRQTRDVYYSGE